MFKISEAQRTKAQDVFDIKRSPAQCVFEVSEAQRTKAQRVSKISEAQRNSHNALL